MRLITALDVLGKRSSPINEWARVTDCPWCGEQAWISGETLQCLNLSCTTQVATAIDVLALHKGGYADAYAFVRDRLGSELHEQAFKDRNAQRRVLDFWVSKCLQPLTTGAALFRDKLSNMGLGVSSSRFNLTILTLEDVLELLDLAVETGASYPESIMKSAPTACWAYCVQSTPGVVDRIILVNARGTEHEFVWRPMNAGVCSMIGLRPDSLKIMAPNADQALRMQHTLRKAGSMDEVVFPHLDIFLGNECPKWYYPKDTFIAAVDMERGDNSIKNDVASIQALTDQIHSIGEAIKAMPSSHVLLGSPTSNSLPWDRFRFAAMVSMIPDGANVLPPECASLYEITGARPDDTAALTKYFTKRGRFSIVKDVETLSMNRVIARDKTFEVKETACDYRLVKASDERVISNFNLRVDCNVSFKNIDSDNYCKASIRCGTTHSSVVFRHSMLSDKVQNLESELQRQLTSHISVHDLDAVPTIVDIPKFRSFVIPHLRSQVANTKQLAGVDRLGWSVDRKSYSTPDRVITIDGVVESSGVLAPSMPILKRFTSSGVFHGGDVVALESEGHRDVAAMLVASIVRRYNTYPQQPVFIKRDSAINNLCIKLMQVFGQTQYVEGQNNARSSNKVEGIDGYPLFATSDNDIPIDNNLLYFHLGNSGYVFPKYSDDEDSDKASRVISHLCSLATDWCLGGYADGFQIEPSTSTHMSMMREGAAIIQQVTSLDTWDVSAAEPSALEKLFRQIPYESTIQRFTLVDGYELVIDKDGLDIDEPALLDAFKESGAMAAIDNESIITSAPKFMPAIDRFYGQKPEIKIVVT